MQLVQLNDIVMGSLEPNADAMLAHWQLCLSQLIKVDSCLVAITIAVWGEGRREST